MQNATARMTDQEMQQKLAASTRSLAIGYITFWVSVISTALAIRRVLEVLEEQRKGVA